MKDSILYHPERISVMGIRSVASQQRGTHKEQGFTVYVFKGLALLPEADRRPETQPSFTFLPFLQKQRVAPCCDAKKNLSE